MRIEYFQLIDRITDLNLPELTIRAEATEWAEGTGSHGETKQRRLTENN